MNNLKKLILIFIYVLLATWTLPDLTFAKIMDSREIEIRAKEKKNDPRSLLPMRAWVDGQMIYVSFWDLPSTATVIITNVESGESITKSFLSPETVSVPINNENGTYEIQISYEEKVFTGEYKL